MYAAKPIGKDVCWCACGAIKTPQNKTHADGRRRVINIQWRRELRCCSPNTLARYYTQLRSRRRRRSPMPHLLRNKKKRSRQQQQRGYLPISLSIHPYPHTKLTTFRPAAATDNVMYYVLLQSQLWPHIPNTQNPYSHREQTGLPKWRQFNSLG